MISQLKIALFCLFFLSCPQAKSSLIPDHFLEEPTVHHFKVVPDSDADSTCSLSKITVEKALKLFLITKVALEQQLNHSHEIMQTVKQNEFAGVVTRGFNTVPRQARWNGILLYGEDVDRAKPRLSPRFLLSFDHDDKVLQEVSFPAISSLRLCPAQCEFEYASSRSEFQKTVGILQRTLCDLSEQVDKSRKLYKDNVKNFGLNDYFPLGLQAIWFTKHPLQDHTSQNISSSDAHEDSTEFYRDEEGPSSLTGVRDVETIVRLLTEKLNKYCTYDPVAYNPQINNSPGISQSLHMAKDMPSFHRNNDQQVPAISPSPKMQAQSDPLLKELQLYVKNYIPDKSSPRLPTSLPEKTQD